MKSSMKKYYFATCNNNKFQEVSRIMSKLNPNITIDQLDTVFDEIQGTPEEISIDKTKKVVKSFLFTLSKYKYSGLFTEDISLHCGGLYGMPGPYIKEAEKNIGLLNLSNLVIGTGNTEVTARACYTLYKITDDPTPFKKDYNIFTISKTVSGNIVNPRGSLGFGFDKIFQPTNYNKTFAEMSPDDKDNCSYRNIALTELNKLF